MAEAAVQLKQTQTALEASHVRRRIDPAATQLVRHSWLDTLKYDSF